MMKKILVLILCVLVYSALFAQSNEDKKTVFQLSFVPPLSTNGVYSHQYTNTVSLNLLVGISRNEEAFTWGGISNIILNDAKGFQMAGLSNYVGTVSYTHLKHKSTFGRKTSILQKAIASFTKHIS